jgi:hypothetical protein
MIESPPLFLNKEQRSCQHASHWQNAKLIEGAALQQFDFASLRAGMFGIRSGHVTKHTNGRESLSRLALTDYHRGRNSIPSFRAAQAEA